MENLTTSFQERLNQLGITSEVDNISPKEWKKLSERLKYFKTGKGFDNTIFEFICSTRIRSGWKLIRDENLEVPMVSKEFISNRLALLRPDSWYQFIIYDESYLPRYLVFDGGRSHIRYVWEGLPSMDVLSIPKNGTWHNRVLTPDNNGLLTSNEVIISLDPNCRKLTYYPAKKALFNKPHLVVDLKERMFEQKPGISSNRREITRYEAHFINDKFIVRGIDYEYTTVINCNDTFHFPMWPDKRDEKGMDDFILELTHNLVF